MQSELQYLPITALQAGHFQPRQDFDAEAIAELAESIVTHGLIEPLVVRLIGRQHYEIIAGERRWRAAKLAQLTLVPCLVGEYTDRQACALTLIENIQRQDLNPVEEATGYKRLIDEFHYRQDEVALLVGKSRSHIANLLRLLSLHSSVTQQIRDKQLSLGHARLLVGLTPEAQSNFAQQTINKQWSVRQLEEAVKHYKDKPHSLPEMACPGPKDKDIARLENVLAEQLGAPVQIISNEGQGGFLQLQFFNNDTLAGLLERLGLGYD